MTSNESLFYQICEKYNLSYTKASYNTNEIVVTQPYVLGNYSIIIYCINNDKLFMASKIVAVHNEIRYHEVEPFNSYKFNKLIKKYNRFVLQFKQQKLQQKLQRINKDF